MAKTLFPGSKRVDAGFSLFSTLCVLCALSFVAATVFGTVRLRYAAAVKKSAQFYSALEAQNERVRAEVVQTEEETYAAD